jgi:hypothetical protein
VLDVDGGDVDTLHCVNSWICGERKGETARAASYIQHAFGGDDTGEIYEQWSEATAPTAHLQLVSVAVARRKRG